MLVCLKKGVKGMAWKQGRLVEAMKRLTEEFDKKPRCSCLAVVWREGEEYSIMPSWMVENIGGDISEGTLRIVLWVTREEYHEVLAAVSGGV